MCASIFLIFNKTISNLGVLQFASSGKWPNELNAVRRMISAFYINLAARLNKECNLTSQPFVNHIDIMKVCLNVFLIIKVFIYFVF